MPQIRLLSNASRTLINFLAGFLVAIGLMVFDEILTLAIYCAKCGYAIPLLGTWALYDAEGLSWIFILTGFVLIVVNRKYSPS